MNVTVICRQCGATRIIAGSLADSDVIRCNDCATAIGVWSDIKALVRPDRDDSALKS
jgi:hypothetical protein